MKEETRKRLQRLGEAVNVFLSGLAELKPRLLSAAVRGVGGVLGALNTGTELPLYPANTYGFLSFNVANTRVTFHGDHSSSRKASWGIATARVSPSGNMPKAPPAPCSTC